MFKTVIVVDSDLPQLPDPALAFISFADYLKDYPKINEPKTRIINLCNTARYLSQGYYCSLLAEARQHHVLPSVKTINALRMPEVNDDGNNWLERRIALSVGQRQQLNIYFGHVSDKRLQSLAAQLFNKYPAPILQLTLEPEADASSWQLQSLGFDELSAQQQQEFLQALTHYANVNWKKQGASKRYRWDMAILVNPDEHVPPSDKAALQRFVKAAEKLGIFAQTVSAQQLVNIHQYDALFIRETTAIDHHTYRLARKAEANGLVVIDDPDSILRCCNKVFLHDAFNYKKVPSLKTQVLSAADDEGFDALEQIFSYPMILKMPEGSFSKGVHKANNRQELQQITRAMVQESALVLVQEYCFTDYDWRIGVLNGRAIYACRYYMARNHWQIYNHGAKRFSSGGFDALPTFEVPKAVLSAALKACQVVGNGLYGVDIKFKDGKAYVLEVNDNPSIEHGVEDAYLGDELYMQLMTEFLRRLEMRGR